MTQSAPLLSVQNLSLRFGGIVALNQVSLSVEEGSITAVIGPNGAGKTTLFNCVTGFYRGTGRIELKTENGPLELTEMLGGPISWKQSPLRNFKRFYSGFFGGTHRVARAGIARTFQNIRLFSEMTVLENLLVAQHLTVNRNLISGLLNLPSYRRAEAAAIERAYAWLGVLGLEAFANQSAATLSYGNQRRLEIARAMCTGPKLICLDEPAAGLNPRETEDLAQLIRTLRKDFGVTVLVIEHDMPLVMSISDHIVVLNYGQVIASGTADEVRKNPEVLAAYLGAEEA